MPSKISVSMTWLSWLSHCTIFQITKRNNELTDYPIMIFFCLFFLFNQSKNNAVLETKTGHFRGLVDFEAKAKDLSFDANVKDLKMCPRVRPRGQGRPRGLRLG